MKKTIYEAPAAEQINVRFEENIMSAQVEAITKKTGVWEEE